MDSSDKKGAKHESGGKRKYHSPLRQQQAAATRDRIILAGAELIHGFTTWDWKNLSASAVGEQAGVSERTVHRHFASEAQLRQAVLQRLVEESGIDLEQLTLEGFGDVASTVFNYLISFAVASEIAADPAQASIDQMRKGALINAVAQETPQWEEKERLLVVAMLDLLWHPPVYERLKSAWNFDADDANRAINWLNNAVLEALKKDLKP